MHDAAYKRLFSHRLMVEDLLRGFLTGKWTDALDFTTLEKLPAEFVSDELLRRRGDGMWRVQEWYDEAHEKGLKAGLAKGVEQVRAEERALLCRLAARKFDAETAERLSELLDALAAADRLAEIGECIIDCNTGADLLQRAERMTPRA